MMLERLVRLLRLIKGKINNQHILMRQDGAGKWRSLGKIRKKGSS